jgi:phenylacetate-CoA ligase
LSRIVRRAYWLAYVVGRTIGQARYPYASPARIARDADRNVRRMIAHAYQQVPFYRDTMRRLGLSPADIRTVADLARLPLISVADLQRDPEAFRSPSRGDEPPVPLFTSGSTGSPHTVWHDLASIYTNAADNERQRALVQRLIGKGPRYRVLSIAALRGAHETLQQASRTGALWPKWLALTRVVADDRQSYAEIAAQLNEVRPDELRGFGSRLAGLFLHLDATGEPFHHPALVVYASDTLPEPVRRLIVDKYGIPVFALYQASEALKLGWECEAHDGYHINADHYPTRLVDAAGQDVAPGETGEVVISNLTNRGTVLLNYRLGDLAQRLTAPCPCGRNLPRIGFLQGRANDTLLAADGQRCHWMPIERAIRQLDGVWQWQATQSAPLQVTVALRLRPDCDRDAIARGVVAAVRAVLGEAMAVEVRPVDELAPLVGGKIRHVVNLLDEPAGGD